MATARNIIRTWLAGAIVAGAVLLAPAPAYAPPMGHPVEIPHEEETRPEIGRDRGHDDTPLGLFTDRQRRFGAEVKRRQDEAVRSFPDFDGEPHYSVLDSTSDPYERQALEDLLAGDPIARRIGIASWRFTTAPSQREIEAMLALAQGPLPGTVELGLLLEPGVFGSAHGSIIAAWGDRPRADLPTDGLLDDYLAGLGGKTLIVVGHVEGDAYVLQRRDGSKAAVDIKGLLVKAHEAGIVLLPLGCSTAKAGVEIGFIKEIGTDAVSTFLRALPRQGATVADALSGMTGIGALRVQIKDAANLFQVQVFQAPGEAPASRFRIPYGAAPLPGGPSPAAASLSSTVSANADAARPFLQKHWVIQILTDPWSYIEAFAMLLAGSWLSVRLLRSWAFQQRDRQWLYRLARLPITLCLAALHPSATPFPIGAGLVALAGAGLLGYLILGEVGAIVAPLLLASRWIPKKQKGEERDRRAEPD